MTTIRVMTKEEQREIERTTGKATVVMCSGCSQVLKFIPKLAGMPGTTYGFCDECRPVKSKVDEVTESDRSTLDTFGEFGVI